MDSFTGMRNLQIGIDFFQWLETNFQTEMFLKFFVEPKN